jgi:hypothetical protein
VIKYRANIAPEKWGKGLFDQKKNENIARQGMKRGKPFS